jgi:hypothetical protein
MSSVSIRREKDSRLPFLTMLSDLKNFVNKNKTGIFWLLAIILVALASFGGGYLVASKNNQPPIIIQNPAAASIQKAISPALEEKAPAEKDNTEAVKKQGKFVGSVNSNKYHLPDCPSAKKILPQNQIWFDSEEEAQKAGYVKCGSCGK